MITADSIGKALSEELRRQHPGAKGIFIVMKVIKLHETFKAYKTYELSLWYVLKGVKTLLITQKYEGRVLSSEDDRISDLITFHLLRDSYALTRSQEWKNILNKEHELSNNESSPK